MDPLLVDRGTAARSRNPNTLAAGPAASALTRLKVRISQARDRAGEQYPLTATQTHRAKADCEKYRPP